MIVMDIGNSDTVIGIYKKKKLYKTYRIETKNKNFKKNISEFFKKNIIFNLKSNEKYGIKGNTNSYTLFNSDVGFIGSPPAHLRGVLGLGSSSAGNKSCTFNGSK